MQTKWFSALLLLVTVFMLQAPIMCHASSSSEEITVDSVKVKLESLYEKAKEIVLDIWENVDIFLF